MLFSSMLFLWMFLPLVLVINFFLPVRWANYFLLAASLFFYAWGEPRCFLLLLFSIALCYACGMLLSRWESALGKGLVLSGCVLINLGLLGYFKYSGFHAILPIGISFYTFKIIAYMADLYKGRIKVEKNPLHLALYISFFPQLTAGPITRYGDMEAQITRRRTTPEGCAYGIRRFICGLGKKVILSNHFAMIVDTIWSLPANGVSTGLGWYAAILYTLQIYYDFSGYSDMAVGLGHMFGFTTMENFNYPYIAQSVQEFWRRWHISLSSWFRDYLYIPLGGSRQGPFKTYRNLLIVFFCTGLWHGASLSFIAWGLYYGAFLIMERLFLGKLLDKNPLKILNHLYLLFVAVVGWVMFRAGSLTACLAMLRRMFSLQTGVYSVSMYLSHKTMTFLAAGVLLSGPVQAMIPGLRSRIRQQNVASIPELLLLLAVLAYSITLLVGNAYNPFIYFKF